MNLIFHRWFPPLRLIRTTGSHYEGNSALSMLLMGTSARVFNVFQSSSIQTEWESIADAIIDLLFWCLRTMQEHCKAAMHAGRQIMRQSMHTDVSHAHRNECRHTYTEIGPLTCTDLFAFGYVGPLPSVLTQHVTEFSQWCVLKYTCQISTSHASCLI